MRSSAVYVLFLGLVLGPWTGLSANTLLDCEKQHRKNRIQACSTIIETKSVSGKPASRNLIAIAYYHRGNAYRDRRLYDQAIEDYDRATSLNPAITLGYYHRGNIRLNKGQLERAIADYNQVISLNPKYSDAYFNRAEAFYYQGETDRAIDDYNTALRLDPSLIQAWAAIRRLGVRP